MLHSHYPFDYIRKLPIKNINELIVDAFKADADKRMWDAWIAIYPYMLVPLRQVPAGKNKVKYEPYLKFIPYDEFKKGKPEATTSLTNKEIIDKYEQKKEKHQRGKRHD